jgi:hypothetical protein
MVRLSAERHWIPERWRLAGRVSGDIPVLLFHLSHGSSI